MSASSSTINLPVPITATQAGAENPDGLLKPLLVDADGALIVSDSGGGSSNPSVGPTGDPVPQDATFIGGTTPGGDLRGVNVSSGGDVLVQVTDSVLPEGAATESTLGNCNSLLSSIDSNLSGVIEGTGSTPTGLGFSAYGKATTASPTYVDGKAYPLSLDTDGLLRCNVTNSEVVVTGTVSVSGNVTVVQPTGSNLHVAVDSMPTTTVTGTVAATQSGTWTVQPGNTANTTAWLVKPPNATSSSVTSVNDTNASTTLLASNAARLGASVFNDSTVDLYLKLGATASTTSFTVKLGAGGYYELPSFPSIYTGVIDGIWASDASGAARVTELSA